MSIPINLSIVLQRGKWTLNRINLSTRCFACRDCRVRYSPPSSTSGMHYYHYYTLGQNTIFLSKNVIIRKPFLKLCENAFWIFVPKSTKVQKIDSATVCTTLFTKLLGYPNTFLRFWPKRKLANIPKSQKISEYLIKCKDHLVLTLQFLNISLFAYRVYFKKRIWKTRDKLSILHPERQLTQFSDFCNNEEIRPQWPQNIVKIVQKSFQIHFVVFVVKENQMR